MTDKDKAIELLEKANGLVYNGQHPMPKAEITSLIAKALALLKREYKNPKHGSKRQRQR